MKNYKVPQFLTTDPFNRRGEIGEKIKDADGIITLKFSDGGTGRYTSECLLPVNEQITAAI